MKFKPTILKTTISIVLFVAIIIYLNGYYQFTICDYPCIPFSQILLASIIVSIIIYTIWSFIQKNKNQ